MKYWNVHAEENHGIDLLSPDAKWSAVVKWDGCVHLRTDSGDYVYICELDELIERLQELKAIAEHHFDEFPG